MLYTVSVNKYFSYSEMDHDHNGFVSPGELSYYSNVDTSIECNDENRALKKCVCEVFALKDGLTLKILPENDCPKRIRL